MNDDYTPIQCHFYDYIEIACLRGYQLEIVLIDGTMIIAKALTTEIENKQEWLLLKTINHDLSLSEETEHRIRLDTIKSILPIEANAEFGRIELQ